MQTLHIQQYLQHFVKLCATGCKLWTNSKYLLTHVNWYVFDRQEKKLHSHIALRFVSSIKKTTSEKLYYHIQETGFQLN